MGSGGERVLSEARQCLVRRCSTSSKDHDAIDAKVAQTAKLIDPRLARQIAALPPQVVDPESECLWVADGLAVMLHRRESPTLVKVRVRTRDMVVLQRLRTRLGVVQPGDDRTPRRPLIRAPRAMPRAALSATPRVAHYVLALGQR